MHITGSSRRCGLLSRSLSFEQRKLEKERERERERRVLLSQITPTSADNPLLNVIQRGKARDISMPLVLKIFFPREPVRSTFAPLHAALRDVYILYCVLVF
jgi:hypothetical protein